MKKVYKQLTADQKARGVVFTSTLTSGRTESEGERTHEVYTVDIIAAEIAKGRAERGERKLSDETLKVWAEREQRETIERLLDDSFFNSSPWKYNVIRK